MLAFLFELYFREVTVPCGSWHVRAETKQWKSKTKHPQHHGANSRSIFRQPASPSSCRLPEPLVLGLVNVLGRGEYPSLAKCFYSLESDFYPGPSGVRLESFGAVIGADFGTPHLARTPLLLSSVASG